MGNNELPVFAQRGVEPPKNSLFRELRKIWISEESGRKSKDLAELLDVRQQHLSQWASGTDGREPPWWAVMRVAHEVNRQIVFGPSSVRIEMPD